MLKSQIVSLPDEKSTTELAVKLSTELKAGNTLALYGELGVGKTFFTQQLCKALGVNEYVSSPSYVLINEYRGRMDIAHVDLFRLDDVDEVWETGLSEFLGKYLTIIEWPELVAEILPENTIHFRFRFCPEGREVEITKGHPVEGCP